MRPRRPRATWAQVRAAAAGSEFWISTCERGTWLRDNNGSWMAGTPAAALRVLGA